MVLYNTTFSVEIPTIDLFKKWFNQYYLPLIKQSGYFESYQLLKILANHDPNLTNFSCLLAAKTLNDGQLFEVEFDEQISRSLVENFGEACLKFSTILEKIEGSDL